MAVPITVLVHRPARSQYLHSLGAITLGSWQVYVSSEQHIKELEQAPEDHLSLHAIAKDVGLSLLEASYSNQYALDVPA